VNSETKGYDLAALRERIRRCGQLAGSASELARKAGIPRRTLENYINSEHEPKVSTLFLLAEAAGVSLTWLVTGIDPNGEMQDRQPLRADPLERAIRIVERWLEVHDRTMQPSRKAQVVLAIYDMLVQDMDEGRQTLDERRTETILRLVV